MARHTLRTPTQSEYTPLEFRSALYTPSGYSTIRPREMQEDWSYRSSTSWSSDQLTRHMETAPCPPPDYSTPRPR
eukprot:scaffold21733_cov53-Attheya_sp.AAC.7